MLILGGLEDQTATLVWAQISSKPFSIDDLYLADYPTYKILFEHFVNPHTTNQPFLWTPLSVLLSIFGIGGYNLIIVAILAITFLLTYKLFKEHKYAVIYATIFTFSAYTWSHIGRHIELMQIWLFPGFLLAYFNLEKKTTHKAYKKYLYAGFWVGGSILISNYIGFFILLFTWIYSPVKALFSKNISALKDAFIVSCIGLLLGGIFLVPFISKNYSHSNSASPPVNNALIRPYEDFFTFSSRPWYFVIPPVKNPFLGKYAEQAYSKIESTGHYLADDYFSGEHQSNYFGIVLLLCTGFALAYTLKNSNKEIKAGVLVLLLTCIGLGLFTLPPYVTVQEIKIFTPTEALTKLLPMFRSTTRLSALILLCLLMILAKCIEFLYSQAKDVHKKWITYVMCCVLVVTLTETYIPLKVESTNTPPQVYQRLAELRQDSTAFAVYPYGQTNQAFFWIPVHKMNLINPRGFVWGDLDSELFTDRLNTNEGISNLMHQQAKYLVVSTDIDAAESEFFGTHPNLEIENEFEDYYLYKVVY